jgi:mono/diheme cytochrome c family protein
MAGDDMGRPPIRLLLAFTVISILFVIALAVSPIRDQLIEWRQYKRDYVHFAEGRADTKSLLADFRPTIDQIWIPNLKVIDRCVTCHVGITNPALTGASVPQPFRSHPAIPHRLLDWGCVVCHRGQGLATETRSAHDITSSWEKPLLPNRYIQASCGVCHQSSLPETPKLGTGREVIVNLYCIGCHRLEGIERPVMLGPDLTDAGVKVSRKWIYKWLKEPRTITDSNGNTVVDGYESEEEPRMPKFQLEEEELKALSAYVDSLRAKPLEAYRFDPRVVAKLEKQDVEGQGQIRFREMFCTTCHAVAVTRAGETQLIGGDIGPELTKVGSKVNTNWLIAWLRDPQSYLPKALMPRYGWSDEDLYKVQRYIMTDLTDPELLSDVPKLGASLEQDIQSGRRLFIEKGCSSCHVISGIKSQSDFGPDLTTIGERDISQLDFGPSKIPKTLISYIQTKTQDPRSVNPSARMPEYHFKEGDSEAATVALLGMTGPQTTPGIAHLVLPAGHPVFQPAGKFGKVYERFKCYVCHRFNGYGGSLAPELSFEGSRAQRRWLIDFLKNPETLRPTLTYRMPQFNMSDEDATTAADYLGMVLLKPDLDPDSVDAKSFTAGQAKTGEQLYEVKYQCQSCHTIGASGGYVGPNLSKAGSWLNAAWIEGWLKDPQALVPGTIDPRRTFTEQELKDLTAYILTLKKGNQGSGMGGVQ